MNSRLCLDQIICLNMSGFYDGLIKKTAVLSTAVYDFTYLLIVLILSESDRCWIIQAISIRLSGSLDERFRLFEGAIG